MTRQLTDWLGHQNREISILSLEDFAKDPKSSTLSLCGWIGIEFDHTSINYWDRDLHYIGGNHSVKRLIQIVTSTGESQWTKGGEITYQNNR